LSDKFVDTRIGSEQSGKLIAEFKLTSTINENIVIKLAKLISSLEKIERTLKGKRKAKNAKD